MKDLILTDTNSLTIFTDFTNRWIFDTTYGHLNEKIHVNMATSPHWVKSSGVELNSFSVSLENFGS